MANTCCPGSGDTGRRKFRIQKSACCAGQVGSEQPRTPAACCGADQADDARPEPAPECTSLAHIEAPWVTGQIATPAGEVAQVATKLTFRDTLGSWKCRWSVERMDYKVDPGIYAVGTPDQAAPVLVTANYKMTFDRLRKELGGLTLWIVVLNTDGVNVWCAAGKGTFGTDELVRRIRAVRLAEIVNHRTLILPQLAAVGVAAHEVSRQTGFRVVYGTVRAEDIRAFLESGLKATEAMRTVQFRIGDRVVLTPMELVGAAQPLLISFGVFFILNAIGFGHFAWTDLYGLLGAIVTGAIIAPALLPWVPGRAFSFKGALLGLLWAIGFLFLNGLPVVPTFGWLKAAAYLLLLPSISGFLTLNFTGSSTLTSLSGVDREMKIALPMMLFASVGGVLLLLISDFIQLFGGALI
jgi:hypothetical protein